jgi:serine/threonine protein phosphatase PrpC
MSANVRQSNEQMASTGPHLVARSRSEKGVRKDNQDTDAVFELPDGVCGIVADGMGGGVDGKLFSQQAVEMVIRTLRAHADRPAIERIRLAMQTAADAILGLRMSDPRYQNSGTTLALALVTQRADHAEAAIGHIGDSRIYKITGDGVVTLLTIDHNYAEQMIAEGANPDQAYSDRLGQRLTYSLGEELRIERIPDALRVVRLEPNDRLLICSDGVSRMLQPNEFAAATIGRSAQAAADLVVKRALEKGSSDNATAVVIHYATPSAAPARSAVATNHLRRPAMVLIAAFVVLLLGAGAWAWQASARSESTPTVAPTQPLVASETVTVVATERSAPAGPPTSTAAPTNTPTPTATATATATYTPTPTPTKTPLPTSSVRFTPLPGTQSEMTPTQEQAIPTVVLATPEPTQEMTSEPVPETTSEPIPEATPVTVPEPTPEPALPTPQTLVEPAEAPPPTATPEAPSQEAPLDQPEQ